MTESAFTFQHPTLTAVQGKPTAANLLLLRQELYANALAGLKPSNPTTITCENVEISSSSSKKARGDTGGGGSAGAATLSAVQEILHDLERRAETLEKQTSRLLVQ
jgi:hypothetical protein